MLILAFDTATDEATSALVDGGELLGERVSRARTLLTDLDALLRAAGRAPADVDRLVVGTGPGSFTGTRIGLALARGLAFVLDLPVAGVSTLDALGASGATPVIDARRGEVFVAGPRAIAPAELELPEGTTCVGDGARRYRTVLVAAGLDVPPDDDPAHVPWARHHVRLARSFGSALEVEPIYARHPDAIAARSR